ncbi:glutamate--cysteine ligase isoform X1 [Oratosquilla oratoria]|uniref:glutamate--cysteine ligase isoform X1 n=1 Tax=Oratosquilla oratoria TaxID=337810 RepID=UPI003F770FE2
MSSLGKCLLCDGQLSVGETREVKEKGIKTLIDYSIKWKDGKHSLLEGLKSVKVHEKCRKVYTKERRAETFQARQKTSQVPTTSLRSQELQFDFLHDCLFCGKDASSDFLKKESKKYLGDRESVHCIEMLHVKDTILKAGEMRKDEWGKEVCTRICNVVDLVAAEARYHSACMKKFYQTFSGMKCGRPKSSTISEAMSHAFNYLEENREECQFTFSEIFSEYEGELPTDKTIKSELIERYGHDIIVSVNKNRKPVICFRDTGNKILTDAWYENHRSHDEKEERLRIVKTAARIIAEDIRSQMYEADQYPPPENFLEELDSLIPETLQCLVKTIVLKNKKGNQRKWNRKCTAISHAILTAARPNSFISPLQIGLAVHLSQKYGSKHLLNVLSALGLCASYAEAALFQVSALQHPAKEPPNDSFAQFVFDNADVNISTIDGFNTFHSMGGIQCVTPQNNITSDQPITRLTKIPSASFVGQFGHNPIKTFESKSVKGLLNIKVRDLANINPVSTTVSITTTELLWLLGKWQKNAECPGWNGYMEKCTAHFPYDVSQISYLPFTNAPPTNYDTIYTVLNQAVEKCNELKQQSCFVTFDQPLYIKARDIVEICGQDSHLNNVIVRLGGFHLLMSFMGAIGFIMNGSGIKELFSTVYASTSVEKMLTGHAYARALRAQGGRTPLGEDIRD